MSRSSIEIDLRGHLQRSFQCPIAEDGRQFAGYQIIGDGPTTHYYDRYWLDLGTTPIPDTWRDTLRYELRKHPIITQTLGFRDSLNETPESNAELLAKLSTFPEFEPLSDVPAFYSIEFKLADRHEVTIIVTYDAPSPDTPA